jgi:release factor glutamine methyltransferase
VSHTVLSVLRAAEGWFGQHGVDAPKRSAELLLGKVLGLDRLQLYLQHDRPLSDEERAAMRVLTQRRGKGEPVAHLLGSWSFRGLELEVSSAVLIPRPETEELVDLVLAAMPSGARVVDLGTGSGAIAIAIAKERPDVSVVAVDLSKNAIEVATRNVARHGVADRVQLRQGSWWGPCTADAPFDVLVSNPPYVDPAQPQFLAEDVRQFEPPLALFSENGDPGSCYRAICAEVGPRVVPGGFVAMETGAGASDAAFAELQNCESLCDVAMRKDLAGIDRFVVARRRR